MAASATTADKPEVVLSGMPLGGDHPMHPFAINAKGQMFVDMGTATNSEVELICLTAVDFFTGSILIDNLVYPSIPMAHYNTRYSGVFTSQINSALRNGTAMLGRDRARAALLEYIGPDTVVIVHGGRSDFEALRWIHPHVIDTFILEGY